jgi:hypothetical protein
MLVMIEKRLRNYLVLAVLIAAVLMGGRSAWQRTIEIGCLPVDGKPPSGAWMDGCASNQIGSYGLDVLWFDLDPAAVAGITRAKVLIFGDSRVLTAMSQGIASTWFAVRHIPMYLLAFGAGEQSGFADRLVAKFQPRPSLVVFDADPYFTGEESIPAQAITEDPVGEETTARQTKAFLDAAPVYCRYLGWLCGRTERAYRQYLDGIVVHQDDYRVWFNKNQGGSFPITRPGSQVTSHYEGYLANARALVSKLHINPQCIVFTIVPNSEMDDSFAKFLAANLGARVVAPRIDGLSTVDHYHLTPQSAQIWSKAFLADLQPIVQECVGGALASGGPAAADMPIAGLGP